MQFLLKSVFVISILTMGCSDKDVSETGASSVVLVQVIDTGEVQPNCADLECDANATCDEAEVSCVCDDGYTGDGLSCTNIDECADGTDDCADGYACGDTEGSFECTNIDECADGTDDCGDGYTCGDTDGSFDCTNIDECAEGISTCDADASCADTDGSYTCTCDEGYAGDGVSCFNRNECLEGTDDCTDGYSCRDTVGSFACDNIDECAEGTDDCGDGYTCGDTDGSFDCINIDECAEGTDDCGDGYTCGDTDGSFDCTNIDECAEGTDDCAVGYICDDTDGSFDCDADHSPLGTQIATLLIDVDAGTVTVDEQPADLTLAATLDFSTMTVGLTVQNDKRRLIFNLKAVIDTVSTGAVSMSTGTLWFEEDKSYLEYGPAALLPGDSKTQNVSFTGLTGITSVDLHFMDSPMIYGSRCDLDVMDTSMATLGRAAEIDGPCAQRQAVMSDNGRFVYAGEKDEDRINVYDTVNMSSLTSMALSTSDNGEGSAASMVLSPDGASLYVLFTDGAHYQGLSDDDGRVDTVVALIEIDTLTMTEIRRLIIYDGDTEERAARSLVWSPDRTMLAAAVANGNDETNNTINEVWFIDPVAWALMDTDLSTPEADPVTLSAQGYAEQVLWSADKVIVAHNNAHFISLDGVAELSFIDPSDYSLITLVPDGGGDKGSYMSVQGDRLYYSSRDGSSQPINVFDLSTLTEIPVPTAVTTAMITPMITPMSDRTYGVLVSPRGDIVWGINEDGSYPIDATTLEPIDANGDSSDGVTPVDGYRSGAHTLVITPF